jgi:hypothetical protein
MVNLIKANQTPNLVHVLVAAKIRNIISDDDAEIDRIELLVLGEGINWTNP